MSKCVRCGKEIKDVIAADPSKVFYCKKCSYEQLKVDESKIFNDDIEIEEYYESGIIGKTFFYLIPGLYQIKIGKYFLGLIFIFNSLIIPISWNFLLLSILSSDYKGKPEILMFFAIIVFINYMLFFIKNMIDIGRDED